MKNLRGTCLVPLSFMGGEMKNIEYLFEIKKLSHYFFSQHPISKYPEIECDEMRPYNVAVFSTHDDYFVCAPFRFNIKHNNAYLFKHSKRSTKSASRIDYSKTIIIRDPLFIGENIIIDNDEYKEFIINVDKIQKELNKYINDFILHHKQEVILHYREYDRKYRYTTLQYFKEFLGCD